MKRETKLKILFFSLLIIVIAVGTYIIFYSQPEPVEAVKGEIDYFELSCEELKADINSYMNNNHVHWDRTRNDLLIVTNLLHIYELKECI